MGQELVTCCFHNFVQETVPNSQTWSYDTTAKDEESADSFQLKCFKVFPIKMDS